MKTKHKSSDGNEKIDIQINYLILECICLDIVLLVVHYWII